MIVNSEELLQALEAVRPGLAGKELIEQSTSFAFMGGRIVTYNQEISVTHPVEGLALKGAVQAEKLYGLLEKLKGGKEVELTETKTELRLVCGKMKVGLAFESEVRLPLEDVSEPERWFALPGAFLKFLKFASFSCARGTIKPLFTCVNVRSDGVIEATDDYRITQCNLGEQMPISTFLLPVGAVNSVVKLQPTKIAEGKGWVHFGVETGTVLSCRTFARDVFPNVGKHMNVQGTEVILPKAMEEILGRAGVITNTGFEVDDVVEVSMGEKRLKVSARSETSWFEEEASVRYEGEPFTFSVNINFMKGLLEETPKCTIGKDRIRFDGEGWVYLAMLRS